MDMDNRQIYRPIVLVVTNQFCELIYVQGLSLSVNDSLRTTIHYKGLVSMFIVAQFW